MLMPSTKLKVVAVSGGLQRPSKTLTLVEQLLEGLSDALPIETRLIELGEIPCAAETPPTTVRRR